MSMNQSIPAGASRVSVFLGGLLAAVLVAGCSSSGDTRKLDYESSASLPPLEVPPDLTTLDVDDTYAIPSAGGGRVSAAQVGGGRAVESASGVLPNFDDISVRRAGQTRWLEIKATPGQLWPKLRGFLKEQGLEIEKDEPAIGIMETAWAENRAGLTQSGLRKYLGRLYDAGTRDKYRVRVEREGEGVTAVYIAHRGAEEVAAGEDIVKWTIRPSDPELEAEMLRRLMVYLGRDAEAAKAELAGATEQSADMRMAEFEGRPALIIEDAFNRAWRRLGVVLDRLALVVDDQNRAGGTYYVTYNGDERFERGFFKGLFGGGDKDLLTVGDSYQIQMLDRGAYVEVTVYNGEGAAIDDEIAQEILSRVQEELK